MILSPHALGVIIGGLMPAVLFGLGNVFVKAGNISGIGIGLFLIFASFGYFITGLVFLAILPDSSITGRAALFACGAGVVLSMGTGLVSIAIVRYSASISVLTPLYNMNTLVAVLLALWVFSEWKNVHVPSLLFGSLLIVIGGVLVARA